MSAHHHTQSPADMTPDEREESNLRQLRELIEEMESGVLKRGRRRPGQHTSAVHQTHTSPSPHRQSDED